ncbi:MAG: NUDIX hydrolase [Ardenticatenaceae bacterium]|nr:NUDIX hydrolase [Ardenticatenaceae bacterium]MCB8989416.1 NUDIX hydrolase [Ardenticatenaceae bacterium]MCB9004571.1 NUDIX hydrolase [Ardenticatenaceae bacterium]
MSDSNPYTTVNSQIVWSCPWYSVRRDDIITPDGKPGVYNTVTKENAVWIVPVLADGRILLIRNYRYTVDDWCWEVPAGGMENGRTALETAVAELREETDGMAEEIRLITQFYVSNGFCDEVGNVFLATGVTLTHSPQYESTEVMTLHPLPAAEVLRMARAGEITDGPSALALLLCEAHLPGM